MKPWPYKHHQPEDWGQGIEKLDTRLFLQADCLVDVACQFVGTTSVKLRINTAYAEAGHASNSQHYLGKAFDGVLLLDGKPLPLLWQFLAGLKCQFNGFGLYPEWHTQGFHADVRDLQNGSPRAMWIQRGGQYLPLTIHELQQLELTG